MVKSCSVCPLDGASCDYLDVCDVRLVPMPREIFCIRETRKCSKGFGVTREIL